MDVQMGKPQPVPTVVRESCINVKLELCTDQLLWADAPGLMLPGCRKACNSVTKPAASVGGLASLRILPSNELQPHLWAGPQNSLWPLPLQQVFQEASKQIKLQVLDAESSPHLDLWEVALSVKRSYKESVPGRCLSSSFVIQENHLIKLYLSLNNFGLP